jgi:hypothetical protein
MAKGNSGPMDEALFFGGEKFARLVFLFSLGG